MKVNNVTANKYKTNQKVNFKAQIFHQKEIFKSIADTDRRFWTVGQKYERIKIISNAINHIKEMGDSDTGIRLFQKPVTIDHHNCWYNTRITNKKFPDVVFYYPYKNNKGLENISYLDFFNQKIDALKNCIETFEKNFLKHVSNLAQQEPPKVLEMFNIKDAHWEKIADKLKESKGYLYVGLDKDRKTFEEKYLKYLLNRSV